MRIVFMGTPDFAVPTLEKLYNSNHQIVGVYCQPDKPVGRKQILTAPAVKQYAQSVGLNVYQPVTLKDEAVVQQLKSLLPDVIVVVAYGKLLPESVLSIPKKGCINGHGSLLPKYRGASPIQWAIVCGENKTGMTTMYMDKGLDTGDILETSEVLIGENETADELFNRLSVIGADLMLSTLEKAQNNSLNPIKQNEAEASYAPIIKKEMGILDFSKPANCLHNLIRGFNSWPIAYFMHAGKRMKVYTSRVGGSTCAKSGTVVANENGISVACGDGKILTLLEVQLEGGKRMSADEFLKGRKIEVGTSVFGE